MLSARIVRRRFRMSALPPKAAIRPRGQDVCFGPGADISLAKVCERGSEAFPATAAALRKPTGSETLALDRARRHDPRALRVGLLAKRRGKYREERCAVISGNVEQRP